MEIGIYGLGRFGYFYSSILAEHFTVKAFSRSSQRRTPPGVRRVSEEELLTLPVLILCVAISALEEVLGRIAPGLRPGTLIMDTCSVKVPPAAWMREILPKSVDILATHPMFGPDSARGGLKGLPIILSAVRLNSAKLEHWRYFFTSLGLKVSLMDPHSHDREAAFTQGLTHYIGRVLAELDLKESDIASVGYRQLLKIMEQTCNDSWQLFLDLEMYNPYTKQMRQALNNSLAEINKSLDAVCEPAAADGIFRAVGETTNLTAEGLNSNMIQTLGEGDEGNKNQ